MSTRNTNSRSVTIADLGLGNLRSVARAVERAGGEATITADPDALRKSPKVIVPGQGAFRDCGLALERGFGSALREVIAQGTPYLGICLGMQLLFEHSAEAPGVPGLGLFEGTVERFPQHMLDASGARLKVPHMGWNELIPEPHAHAALDRAHAQGRSSAGGSHAQGASSTPGRGWFYFTHSFYCVPKDASLIVGRAAYGIDFCAAVARDNVFACQFHPEKSQEEGHQLLARFVEGGL